MMCFQGPLSNVCYALVTPEWNMNESYRWFSVSHHLKYIKIKIRTVRWFKSRIWQMKGGKYTKTLAKIRVRGILCIWDIRRNVLPKFIEFVWRRHAGAHLDGHQHGGQENNRNISYRVLLQKFPQGTHRH